ncbi:MAG: HEPN domain-containing protein [Acidobacteriia bacterium]|nr:HEPN domain-containing protein [Terriglobia bacterium]
MDERVAGTADIEPMAFVNGATDFAWAAAALHELPNRHAAGPTYLLMAHAIELALKGYLRLQGLSTAELARPPYGHDLGALYTECLSSGFCCPVEKRLDVANVIELLHKSNRSQGLRYFTWESQWPPELTWGVEVVQSVVALVKVAALQRDPNAGTPGPAVKLIVTIGQPQQRD